MSAKRTPKPTPKPLSKPAAAPPEAAKTTAKRSPAASAPEAPIRLTDRQLWILTGVTALAYYAFSFASEGFYQHDEAAHYNSMRDFWHDPNSVLNSWAKPGFKLVYALPALLGPQFVTLFNCIIGALSGLLAYRIAEKYELKTAPAVLILLAVQPQWLQLVFRNYSELLSGFMLVLALFLHTRARYLLAALALSYIAMIRQEAYPIIAMYGLYLLTQKRILPALALAVFPLVNNFWGWAATGDPLYLIHETFGYGSKIADIWPRQGGDHYAVMALTIFGSLTLTLVLANIVMVVRRQIPPLWFVWAPALLYFLLHSLFNNISYPVGPSTGGNLRYMTVISPLLAILAAQTLDGLTRLRGFDARKPLLVLAGLWLIITAIFLTYGHNNVFLLDGHHTNSLGEALAGTEPVRDWKPLLGVLLASGLILAIQNTKAAIWGATGLGTFLLLITVKPYPLAPEDATVKRAADWFGQYYGTQNSVMCQHALFFYYTGLSRYDFKSYHSPMTDSAISTAPLGTIIAWESHYGYRPKEIPNSVQYTYFEERPKTFRRLVDFRSEDNRFGMIFYEKTAENPTASSSVQQLKYEVPANE